MTPEITVLDLNLTLTERIGTAAPLFRAQAAYAHLCDACGCDTQYPAGAYYATVESIYNITGIPVSLIHETIRSAYRQHLPAESR